MNAEPDVPDEGQDLAETFDETNITTDGDDIATSDMQRDVYDVTAMGADAEDSEERVGEEDWRESLDAPAFPEQGDLDPGEARAEGQDLLAETNAYEGEPRSWEADDADRVKDGVDLQPRDLESEGLAGDQLDALGYDEDGEPVPVDDELDRELKQSFPASDPASITRR
ncbi:MAG TPA: primosomal protein [Caulobacteraceae bacterium]|nr:primosomal protein [Caulobacteraceae bacterium]